MVDDIQYRRLLNLNNLTPAKPQNRVLWSPIPAAIFECSMADTPFSENHCSALRSKAEQTSSGDSNSIVTVIPHPSALFHHQPGRSSITTLHPCRVPHLRSTAAMFAASGLVDSTPPGSIISFFHRSLIARQAGGCIVYHVTAACAGGLSGSAVWAGELYEAFDDATLCAALIPSRYRSRRRWR